MLATRCRVPSCTAHEPIALAVAGRHHLMRWAIGRIADDAPDLRPVADLAEPADALALIGTVDVVLVECSAANEADWELVERLRAQDAALGIVVLSDDSTDEVMVRALHSGASAHVAAGGSVHDVLDAIRHAAVAPSSFTSAALAEALRVRLPSASPVPLSAREREVLTLLRDGRSVPEVAASLFVSPSTAKTHVARVYEKLGATNRAQALMRAVELGLFDGMPALAG